ncbi:unnamed protein product [Rhizophagus irregularis]|nr:unnamed protein product [Rhizophagus irregularis]
MESDNSDNTTQIFSRESLPEELKPVLPQYYTYLIQNFENKLSYRTYEGFEVPNFELDAFVNINNEETASEWIKTFQSHSKTTMAQTMGYKIKGNRVRF